MAATIPTSPAETKSTANGPAEKQKGSPKSVKERENRRHRRANYAHAVETICLKANLEWEKKVKAFKEKQQEAAESGEKKKRTPSPKFSGELKAMDDNLRTMRLRTAPGRYNTQVKQMAQHIISSLSNGMYGDLLQKLERGDFPGMAGEARNMKKFYMSTEWRARTLKMPPDEVFEDFEKAIKGLRSMEKLVQCAA